VVAFSIEAAVMDMDAAPAMQMKAADASELWLVDDSPGFPNSFTPPRAAAWYAPTELDPTRPLFS
jgi:hypothetical protein